MTRQRSARTIQAFMGSSPAESVPTPKNADGNSRMPQRESYPVKAILFDFDGTLTRKDVLSHLIDRVAPGKYAPLTHSSEHGEFASLLRRIESLGNAEVRQLVRELSEDLLLPGAKGLFNWLHNLGVVTILISGNLELVLRHYQQYLSVTEIIGTHVAVENGMLRAVRADGVRKRATHIQALLEQLNIDRENIIAVGNEPQDLLLFRFASYTIAMNATAESVRRRADAVIEGTLNDLRTHLQRIIQPPIANGRRRAQSISDVRRFFPSSIDVYPTALCNLHCPFCWGPSGVLPDGLSTSQWQEVVDLFAARGTSAIVFSGGEPLLRADIHILVRHAKARGLHVTLSTNATRLDERGADVLPYVDDIGIPIDGSTAHRHRQMRPGRVDSFKTALRALLQVRANYPQVSITVRTLVCRLNMDDVLNIGMLLSERTRLFDRWKLYQFVPINVSPEAASEFSISDHSFRQLMSLLRRKLPFRQKIADFSAMASDRRYVFVNQRGDVTAILGQKHHKVGNAITTPIDKIAARLASYVEGGLNAIHAH